MPTFAATHSKKTPTEPTPIAGSMLALRTSKGVPVPVRKVKAEVGELRRPFDQGSLVEVEQGRHTWAAQGRHTQAVPTVTWTGMHPKTTVPVQQSYAEAYTYGYTQECGNLDIVLVPFLTCFSRSNTTPHFHTPTRAPAPD